MSDSTEKGSPMDLRACLEQDTVARAGFRAPVSVAASATIQDAVSVMQAERVGCVLIVDGPELLGIFTERDLMRRVIGAELAFSEPIRSVMTPDPVVAARDEPIHRALSRMHAGGFRHLPVVDDDAKPVGTISLKGVATLISDHFAEAVYNLPPEPGVYGTKPEGG